MTTVKRKVATKFIVVTGGVISGIGKGVTASSIGVCMKMLGARVTAVKIDPYLNLDAGTMSPLEHGECFVLDDGGETDLDLGNYERFLDVVLGSDSNLTTGKIYKSVIERERKGEYLGKTVQIIPHITNEIISRIDRVARMPIDESKEVPDICIIELGGTIGDIESMPFVEALRQLQLRVGRSRFCLVHVSMVPTAGPAPGEQKTKPTQHSVKELRGLGLTPDFIVCRSKVQGPILTLTLTQNSSPKPNSNSSANPHLNSSANPHPNSSPNPHPNSSPNPHPKLEVSRPLREKIGLFCNVPAERVLSLYDVPTIYQVPQEVLND